MFDLPFLLGKLSQLTRLLGKMTESPWIGVDQSSIEGNVWKSNSTSFNHVLDINSSMTLQCMSFDADC